MRRKGLFNFRRRNVVPLCTVRVAETVVKCDISVAILSVHELDCRKTQRYGSFHQRTSPQPRCLQSCALIMTNFASIRDSLGRAHSPSKAHLLVAKTSLPF